MNKYHIPRYLVDGKVSQTIRRKRRRSGRGQYNHVYLALKDLMIGVQQRIKSLDPLVPSDVAERYNEWKKISVIVDEDNIIKILGEGIILVGDPHAICGCGWNGCGAPGAIMATGIVINMSDKTVHCPTYNIMFPPTLDCKGKEFPLLSNEIEAFQTLFPEIKEIMMK